MDSRRLSFVEALVCGAIVIASAGVVVPALSIRQLDSRREKAESDLESIAGGIRRFIDDTRVFPTGAGGSTSLHFLYTDGVRPQNNTLASGPSLHLDQFLRDGALGGQNWRGP